MISDGKHDYTYDGTTKNLGTLFKACPISMGVDKIPCVVQFEAVGTDAVNIISAKAPAFGGATINRAGKASDAWVCDNPADVSYDQHVGCKHIDDADVQVLFDKRDVAQIRINGSLKYAFQNRISVTCHGISVSIASFIGKNFPPGMKQC